MDKLYGISLPKSKIIAAKTALYAGWIGFWVLLIYSFIMEVIIKDRLFMIFFTVLMLLAGTFFNIALHEIFKEKRNKITELTETQVAKGYSRGVTASLCCIISAAATLLFEAIIPYFYPYYQATLAAYLVWVGVLLCTVIQLIGSSVINKSIKPVE